MYGNDILPFTAFETSQIIGSIDLLTTDLVVP